MLRAGTAARHDVTMRLLTERAIPVHWGLRIDQCTAPPVAGPQLDVCRHCAVRQLCTVYWTSPETDELRIDSATPFGEWKDLELNVSHALWDDDGFSALLAPTERARSTAEYRRGTARNQIGSAQSGYWA